MTRRKVLRSAFAAPYVLLAGTPGEVKVRKIKGGFHFTEAPVFDKHGDLFFSDVAEERIYCLSRGSVRVVRNSSNLANGLAFDQQGRLIVCERGRVTRTEADGRLTILADTYNGKGLHWPNDLVVRSDGSVFFTDLKQKQEWPNPAKTGINAVYRWVPNKGLTIFSDDCEQPNGIALSPKQDRLYVSDTAGRIVLVYEPGANGPCKGREFAKTSVSGGPDGVKTDISGNLWVCEAEGVLVLNPQGQHLFTFRIPENPSNCTFSPDRRALIVTARTSIYELETGDRFQLG